MTGNSYSSPICLSIPAAIPLSAGLSAEAWTRTSTSFGAGVGPGRSSRNAGGVSNASRVTAFIARVLSELVSVDDRGRGPDEAGVVELVEQEGRDVGPRDRGAELVATEEAGPHVARRRAVDRAGAGDRPLEIAVDHDLRHRRAARGRCAAVARPALTSKARSGEWTLAPEESSRERPPPRPTSTARTSGLTVGSSAGRAGGPRGCSGLR